MTFLDNFLGRGGGDAAAGVGELLKGQGGVTGLAEAFRGQGLGEVVQSWIGQGGNLPVTAEQIGQVLGSGPVAAFAERLGVSPEQAGTALAGLLPQIIDGLTPNGEPQEGPLDGLLDQLPGGVGGLISGFLKR